ncbi:MAG: DUF3782 domain-containing protein [Campylobacterota bacterium]
MQYTQQQMLDVVNKQLLLWIKKDETVKNAVFELVQKKHPTKKETDDKFEKMLSRMDEDRIRQDKKWEEQNAKWEDYLKKSAEDKETENKKWAEHLSADEKKWTEQRAADEKRWTENQKVMNDNNKKHEQFMGAIGARWGLNSEASFRNALKGILRELDSQYEVIRYEEIDEEGIVFDRPGPVEIDVIIKNGKIYLIEIKSSVSKSDVFIFLRKVKYYEKRHKKKVFQIIMISPMIDEKVKEFAQGEKVKLYSYANDVSL